MFGLNSKNAPKAEPTYAVAYRGVGTPGFTDTMSREQALAAFVGCLYVSDPATGDYAVTPWSGRRIYVTGPDYCIQDDDPSDPLLIGTAALRAVLAPDEYADLVQAPVAAALLES